jgi:hypothetical protein
MPDAVSTYSPVGDGPKLPPPPPHAAKTTLGVINAIRLSLHFMTVSVFCYRNDMNIGALEQYKNILLTMDSI